MKRKVEDLIKHLKLQKSSLLLIKEALTHSSYLNESGGRRVKSYERLEYLGDAVLSLVVATYLFGKYRHSQEGELTSLRSLLVQEKTLSIVAKNMNLGEYLILSKGEEEQGGKENASILAATFEALVGAIYLSEGFEQAKKFIESHIISQSDQLLDLAPKDHKSKLQEMVQEKLHTSPLYKLLDSFGPEHQKRFLVGVYLSGRMYGSGIGQSKQDAEQEAASRALEKLKVNLVKSQLALPIREEG